MPYIFVPGSQFSQVATSLAGGVTEPYAYTNDSVPIEDATWPTPLGTIVSYVDSKGRILAFQYVQYLTTTAATTNYVAPVYWADNTQTIVTQIASESVTATINDVCGVLLNPNVTKGNATWMQIYGYLGASSDSNVAQSTLLAIGGGVTKGYLLIGAAAQTYAEMAANTAPTNRPFAEVYTTQASTSGVFDAYIDVW